MMKAMMVVAVAAAAIAAAGPSALAGRAPAQVQAPRSASLLARVNVAASEFKFVLSKKTARRGLVIFRVTNAGAVQHDFEIKGRKTRLLSHGQSATLRVTFLRKGRYPYKCTVPGHAAAGMKGVFTIS
jgi:uncharacterized cupredoxin-like copper-binding protein